MLASSLTTKITDTSNAASNRSPLALVLAGTLGSVSMFGALQRPPIVPFNLTYIIFIVFCISAVFHLAVNRQIRIGRRMPSDIAILIVLILTLFSSFLATLFYDLPLNLAQPETLTFYGSILLYYLIRGLVRTPAHIYLILKLLLIGFLLQFAFSILSFLALPQQSFLPLFDGNLTVVDAKSFEDGVRLESINGNPNNFATLPILALPLALAWYGVSKKYRYRLGLAVIIGLSFSVLLLSYSRSAWIGCILAVSILLIRLTSLSTELIKRRTLPLLIPISIIVTILIGSSLNGDISSALNRINSISESQSTGGRFEMWQHAVFIAQAYPTGVGMGNYGIASLTTSSPFWHILGRSPHNSIIAIGAQGGWVAGFAFLWFLIEQVGSLVKPPKFTSLTDKVIVMGIAASFLALLIHLNFHIVHQHSVIWIMAACLTSLRQFDIVKGSIYQNAQ